VRPSERPAQLWTARWERGLSEKGLPQQAPGLPIVPPADRKNLVERFVNSYEVIVAYVGIAF